MKTYLSIDIDYWNDRPRGMIPYLNKVYKDCQKRRIPLVVIKNHQQALPLVNKSGAERLINIDFHTDLCGEYIDQLNCGTWVNYVKWQRKGEYLWIHPGKNTNRGECGAVDLFSGNGRVARKKNEGFYYIKWKSVRHQTRRLPTPSFLNLTGVSICISPSYSYDGVQETFKKWRKGKNIKMMNSRYHENDSVYKEIKIL